MNLTRRRPRPSSPRAMAFTLVEAVVAVLIIALLFSSLYAGITYSFSMLAVSRENLRATQIILEKFETLRLYNWDQVNASGFIPANFTEPFNPNSSNSTFYYTGAVSVAGSEFTETYSNDLRKVKVSVEWVSKSVLRTREMESYVAREGLQNYIY